MSTALVGQARRLLEQLMLAPWEAVEDGSDWHVESADGVTVAKCDGYAPHLGTDKRHAEFIAWCRDGVPALVAEVRRLREALELEGNKAGVRGNMLRYIAFVTTGDESGDAQLGADRLTAELERERAIRQRLEGAEFPAMFRRLAAQCVVDGEGEQTFTFCADTVEAQLSLARLDAEGGPHGDT